ncbi:multiheme c-type cytochrome [Isosphaeraceae bacterium EP7]
MRVALLVSLLILAAILATRGVRVPTAASPLTSVKKPIDRSAQPSSNRFVGVGGCSAYACHGGIGPTKPEAGDVVSKGGEYVTWLAYDPHANAGDVLKEPRSERIVRALGLEGPASSAKACLGCHATGGETAGEVASAAVSCESCHGPARGWLASHTAPGRRAEALASGMVDTKDLRTRASGCASCHVGDATRQVNHDLIAAGHPRLAFVFEDFQARYPRHWQEPGTDATETWALGQVATAQAALDLLATRSDAASEGRAPWPEFSEYGCFACHHQYRDSGPEAPKGRPGELPFGTWTYATLPEALGTRPGDAATRSLETFRAVDAEMRRPVPDPVKVASGARLTSKALGDWLALPNSGESRARLLLRTFLDPQRSAARRDWDGRAQDALALAALKAAAPVDSGTGLDEAIREAYRRLQFPAGQDSPGALPAGTRDAAGHR